MQKTAEELSQKLGDAEYNVNELKSQNQHLEENNEKLSNVAIKYKDLRLSIADISNSDLKCLDETSNLAEGGDVLIKDLQKVFGAAQEAQKVAEAERDVFKQKYEVLHSKIAATIDLLSVSGAANDTCDTPALPRSISPTPHQMTVTDAAPSSMKTSPHSNTLSPSRKRQRSSSTSSVRSPKHSSTTHCPGGHISTDQDDQPQPATPTKRLFKKRPPISFRLSSALL